MPETQDPLRSLFQQAAGAGQDSAVTAPVALIAARGRRARRRRFGALTVIACLVFGGGAVAVAALLPGEPAPVGPAGTPPPGRPAPKGLPSPAATATATAPRLDPTPPATPESSISAPASGTTHPTATEPP
ncbi:hypothetical protein ACH4OW_11395 [Streptomyces sp. NPDC017056]|uniref:hypothetical protein n=1 Tax=Streptomyces sp. NPDC017056 TaxID=3364973 RepID=UPI0037997712